jgi:Xaa-Pro aminopeptidase
MDEFNQKQQSIRALLERTHLDALVLQNVSSFAWATCGAAAYVNSATTPGIATLLITPTSRHLVTNNIEATRLKHEEKLVEQGWEFHVSPWYATDETLTKLGGGLMLGADGAFPGALDLSTEVGRLRTQLTPQEGERYRLLCTLCAEAMDTAARSLKPGQSEHEIAARLGYEAQRRGAQPIVNLIATDERIFSFRHPLPTTKTLERYAMLVLCGRRWGLVASITRLVHFGPMPDEVRRKSEAVARIDATMMTATRPGKTLGEIFGQIRAAYAEAGFADEWQLHHQGGLTGYEPREFIAVPDSPEMVRQGQAFAWNPSITGAKSEDTILVGESDNEVMTAIQDWPSIPVAIDGREILRPAILEVR